MYINYRTKLGFELQKTSMAILSQMVPISSSVQSNCLLFANKYSANLRVWAPPLPLQIIISTTVRMKFYSNQLG